MECFRGGAGSPPSATTYVWVDYIKWGDGTGEDSTSPPSPPPEPTYPNIHSFSSEQTGNEASKLVDGNTNDAGRWSAETFPQWAIVDYGEAVDFKASNVFTMEDRAYQYRIDASDSPTSGWETIVDRTGNTSATQPIRDDFASTVSARYIRLTVTGAHEYTGSWVSINELEMVEGTVPTVTTVSMAADGSGQNPSSFRLLGAAPGHVTCSVPAASRVAFGLFDMNGQRVWKEQTTLNQGLHLRSFAHLSLAPGLYIVRAQADPVARDMRQGQRMRACAVMTF